MRIILIITLLIYGIFAKTQAQIQSPIFTSLSNLSLQPGLLPYYTFDDLGNKQGNTIWKDRAAIGAPINNIYPKNKFTSGGNIKKQSISNIINDYMPALAFNICNNTLTVESASAFNPGDTVLLIQMKGAIIDSTNTASFGTITNYRSAGNYEFNIVKQKNDNTITLLNTLERQYNFPDGKVQLIRVPYYKNVDISSTLTCLPWDGSKGGVLVFNVENTLTMNADIDVSGRGFRHGAPMDNTLTTLNMQGYYYDVSTNNGAQKGEGIYSISANRNYGRGASANGGGGGNGHNTGGGGGGNGGVGGMGGDQWKTGKTITENVGGKEGKALSNSSALNKLFLGGAGGMGQANDQREYPAGNGGGIIIISAQTLSNISFKMKANGNSATEAPNSAECKDGMAGGGGGGSISLNINHINSNVNLEARGGKGADHIAQNVRHGPGGGGGGGVIAFNQSAAPAQYLMNVSGGINGVNVYHSNDPWGATPGASGITLKSFKSVIDQIAFQSNIDSVKMITHLHDCYHMDFQGVGYTQTYPMTTWAWDFGDGNSGTTQNVSYPYPQTGTFNVKLTGTDINGCKDSAIVPIAIAGIKITKSPDTSICKNSTASLLASGGVSYAWSPSSSLSNSGIPNPVANPITNTTYSVKVTDAAGCSKTTSIKVAIKPVPVIAKINDSTICNKASVKLFVTGGSSYLWSPSATLNNPASASPIATPLSTTAYHVLITDANSCTYQDSVLITVMSSMAFSVSPDSSVCVNNSRQLKAFGGDTYLWSPAGSLDDPNIENPVATPNQTTAYSVLIKENTCNESATLFTTLTVLPPPNVIAEKSNDITCKQPSANLTALGAQHYTWTPSAGLDNTHIANPVATPEASIVYFLTGTSQNGCSSSDSISIQVEYDKDTFYGLPNSFTPNGDGLNDCFGVKYWGQVSNLDFSIYNRTGQKIFYTNNSSNCWDGTFKGQPQDAGAFVYVIKARTACGLVSKKGVITLLR